MPLEGEAGGPIHPERSVGTVPPGEAARAAGDVRVGAGQGMVGAAPALLDSDRTLVLVGFYSYGEIAPHGEGACDLHNQTMTVTTIGEA